MQDKEMQENVNDGHSWTLGSRLALMYFPLMSEVFFASAGRKAEPLQLFLHPLWAGP